jgi:hypothetical protein
MRDEGSGIRCLDYRDEGFGEFKGGFKLEGFLKGFA